MWEIFALRYATQEQRAARDNFLRPPDPHDAPMPMDYFVWVLRDKQRAIVVDTGFTPEMCAARGRTMIRPLPEALAALGVDPARVEDVVITHLHYDHAGNLGLFPKARFHLQEREMAFATGANMCFACLRYAFEVEDVVAFLRSQGEPAYLEEVTEAEEGDAGGSGGGGFGGLGSGDGEMSLFDQAVDLVAREGKASTSFIQRHLQIGYNRAAKLIEQMEKEGIVSAANHVGKREVLARRPDE